MNLEEELKLIGLAQTDILCFGPIYDYYYPKIFGYVFRRLGLYESSRDITAETFIKALTHIQKYNAHERSIAPWLFTIATNEINLFYRNKKYKPANFQYIQPESIQEKEYLKLIEKE